MVTTIDDLTVTLRVEGPTDADEAAFARMFDRHIERWHRQKQLEKTQAARTARDRSFGDTSGNGEPF